MNTFLISFDGGTVGSPKGPDGYGSWRVEFLGFTKQLSRQLFMGSDYSFSITSNAAEYLALIGALSWLGSVKDKINYNIWIRGDSQLVLNQLTGKYKVKSEHLKTLHALALVHLRKFKFFNVEWQPRINNVRRFGH